VLALAISAHFKLRTMIIVHKEFLAQQWRERIEQFCPGAKVGIVQQNKKEVEGCDYVIAMLQSLSMKEYVFSDFESVGVLIVDECHHICARTFSQALFKVVPRHVFGLSATPERKDGLTKLLTWFIGPTAFSVERKAQRGVEVFPITFNDALFRTAPPVTRNGQLSLVGMITALCECRARNQMLCRLIKRASAGTRKLLVLSDRRLHCEMLHQAFKPIGGLYMGGMKQKDLQASSECKIIFATYSQAHEGLDIPTLDTVILATPKSDIVQSIGRIMRGKAENNPHIYDVRDEWGGVFPAMYYKRLKVYKLGGYTIIPDGKQTDPTVADDAAEFRKKCHIKI
jgi:superfamily II DNA or RNA helicase